MDTDETGDEETGPDDQAICDAIRRAVDDRCAASYLSLDRLLAAVQSAELREWLRDRITSDATAQGHPVPWDAHWHLVYIRIDGMPDGMWSSSTEPDLVLPGCVIVMACDDDRYARAQQSFRDLAATKVKQAKFN